MSAAAASAQVASTATTPHQKPKPKSTLLPPHHPLIGLGLAARTGKRCWRTISPEEEELFWANQALRNYGGDQMDDTKKLRCAQPDSILDISNHSNAKLVLMLSARNESAVSLSFTDRSSPMLSSSSSEGGGTFVLSIDQAAILHNELGWAIDKAAVHEQEMAAPASSGEQQQQPQHPPYLTDDE